MRATTTGLVRDLELLEDVLLCVVNNSSSCGVQLAVAMPLKEAAPGLLGVSPPGQIGDYWLQVHPNAMKPAELSMIEVVTAIRSFDIRWHLATVPTSRHHNWSASSSALVETRWNENKAKFCATLLESMDKFTPEMVAALRSDMTLGLVKSEWRTKIEGAVTARLGIARAQPIEGLALRLTLKD